MFTKNTLKKKFRFVNFLILFLSLSTFCLSWEIIHLSRQKRSTKINNSLLLRETVEKTVSQGYLPPKHALPKLEKAFISGYPSTTPYAGVLAALFYFHKDYPKGVYYSHIAHQAAKISHIPSEEEKLFQEISLYQAQDQYQKALDLAISLNERLMQSNKYPTLRFLTLLRIIDLKDLLQLSATTYYEELQSLPIYQEYKHFFKEGNWSLYKCFQLNAR